MKISLVANTGIQFYSAKVNLGGSEESENENPLLDFRSIFYERVETDIYDDKHIHFDYAYKHKTSGMYVEYDALRKSDAYDEDNDKILENKILPEHLKPIRDDWKIKTDAATCLEMFENQWLPIPYFKLEMFSVGRVAPFTKGPEAWARMYISSIPKSQRKDNYTHEVVIAFDTTIYPANQFPKDEIGDTIHVALTKQDYGNSFRCPSERFMLDYCDRKWVNDWIQKEHAKRMDERGESKKKHKDYLHIAQYLTVLMALKNASKPEATGYASRAVFPEVMLHTQDDNQNPITPIEVDLILDVGNSRTYGLVVESIIGKQPTDFSNVKPLPIRDLGYPNRYYTNPFSMQVTFAKHEFGRDEQYFKQYHSETGSLELFKWGSLLRVGPEATRLSISNSDKAVYSSLSSPKRYLWDTKENEDKWTYISKDTQLTQYQGALFGMANLFTENGELKSNAQTSDNKFVASALHPKFSRASLMTFTLTEIIMHAFSYINSYDFRNERGNEHKPRKLRRIVMSCPTAMIPEEQKRLREHAATAIKALEEFYKMDNSFVVPNMQVIPKPSDLTIDPDRENIIRDWSYDEATCNQLLFVYGEIAEQFQNNPSLFFKSKGKIRDDAPFSAKKDYEEEKKQVEQMYANDFQALKYELAKLEENNKKAFFNPAVTIASIDIGGGTTDLMICTYQNDEKAVFTSLQPKPEFWEGFQIAGDDILKMLIERIILPTIRDKARELGCDGQNLENAMRLCFGANWTEHTAIDKHFRKQFGVQIGVPVALGCLQFVKGLPANSTEVTKKVLTDFFGPPPMPNTPKDDLRQHINKTFNTCGARGFSIDKLIFTLDAKRINQVIMDVVEDMLKNLCEVISQFKCDYLLLCGKPGSLPIVREIILRNMPVSPDRIITLEGYRTGTWCPFGTSNGVIEDAKTCVAVGAMVALLGGHLNVLENFRLDTSLLAKNVKSTADYVGVFDKKTRKLRNLNNQDGANGDVLFNIRKNGKAIKRMRFDTPILLGLRQMNNSDWPASPMYAIRYRDPSAGERLKPVLPLNIDLEIETERDGSVNYFIKFEKIENAEPVDKKNDKAGDSFHNEIEVVLQTLADEYGYWLDTGIFDYNIYG